MSEEENKAIKFLQKLEFDEYEWWYSGEEYETREETEKAFEKAQKIIINLIEKQQKEIKELNLENQAFYEEMNCNDNEYISKKYLQLKEKNKKLQEEIKELNSEFAINTEIHKRDMKIKELEEVNNCLHEINKNYISKDKIRDKIKEIEEHLNFENTEMEDYAIAVLKELLEEE